MLLSQEAKMIRLEKGVRHPWNRNICAVWVVLRESAHVYLQIFSDVLVIIYVVYLCL